MNWSNLQKTDPDLIALLEGPIRQYIHNARWYGGKSSRDKAFLADHLLPLDFDDERYYLFLVEIIYEEGFVHNYQIPLSLVPISRDVDPKFILADWPGGKFRLVDAVCLDHFRNGLFRMLKEKSRVGVGNGSLAIARGRLLKYLDAKTVTSHLLHVEQSHTTMVFQDTLYFKFFRRLFRDPNPDIEMVQFLSEKAGFDHIPAFAASLTWQRNGIYDVSLGLMQAKVPNEGDAWSWFLGQLGPVLDQADAGEGVPSVSLFKARSLEGAPLTLKAWAGTDLLHAVKMMAIRTAQMHIHLGSESVMRTFTRQNYTSDYAVWLKNRIIYQFEARYALLDRHREQLSGHAAEYADFFFDQKTEIKNRIFAFDESTLSGQRIRIHGDFHLGQLLVNKGDFYILDFEGEPEATVHDRKVKQSPLKDVAGLFRSFHYAIHTTIFHLDRAPEDQTRLFTQGEKLYAWLVAIFLFHYLKSTFSSPLNIGYRQEIEYLLKYHLLEKAIYELGYELNARPDWAVIPLRGIYNIVHDNPAS